MSIKLKGATSGSVSLDVPAAVSGGDISLTLPNGVGCADQVLVTNGSGTLSFESRMPADGPAFSAYQGTASTITTATFVKIPADTEEFDTNSNYDSSTNYRFTPTVAGYYQLSAAFHVSTDSALSRTILEFYKNGVSELRIHDLSVGRGSSSFRANGSTLLYMNGTTDYVEAYVYIDATGTITLGYTSDKSYSCLFQGVLVRPA